MQVKGDTLISGLHFAIEGSERGFHLRDLGSRNGTKLNGARVKEALLRDQDYIVAGQTGFSVIFVAAEVVAPPTEKAAPPPAAPTAAGKPGAAPPQAAPISFEADWSKVSAPAVVAPPKPAPKPEAAPAGPVNLLDYLRGQKEPLYAVLDAARTPRIIELLREFGYQPAIPDTPAGTQPQILKCPPPPEVMLEELKAREAGGAAAAPDSAAAAPAEPPPDATLCQSLFHGHSALEYENFAPYLLRVPPGSELLEILVAEGWGKSWGIYLTCARPFVEVRKHLRQFLMVEMPDGGQNYFRFYDPRVLRAFLPVCTRAEVENFFGPVECYFVEDEEGERGCRFTSGAERVRREDVALLSRAPAVQARD